MIYIIVVKYTIIYFVLVRSNNFTSTSDAEYDDMLNTLSQKNVIILAIVKIYK